MRRSASSASPRPVIICFIRKQTSCIKYSMHSMHNIEKLFFLVLYEFILMKKRINCPLYFNEKEKTASNEISCCPDTYNKMAKKPYVISIRFVDPGRRRKSILETCEKTCIDTGEKIKMATGYKLTLNFNSCKYY